MMWRIALAVWLMAALSLFALNAPQAQFNGCQAGFCSPPSSAAATYVGPGDITSGAIAFYSVGRAYNAAYATGLNPAADVVDTATGLTTCTFHFLATGFVNKTECNATACAVACSITKLYDQTGTGNHVVQATLANMPTLTFNAQNGLPCAAGTNSAAVRLVTAAAITQSAPYTTMAVGERTGQVTTLQAMTGTTIGLPGRLVFQGVANTVRANNGTAINLTASDNAFHALLAVASGTAPLFAVDSSANTSTSSNGSTSLTGKITIMAQADPGSPILNGFVCEAGLWPADLNSSYQAMLANMRSATNGWNF